MNSFVLSQICAFITVLLWSTSYVFTKIALEHFSAESLGFIRCATASLCLLPILAMKRQTLPGRSLLPWFVASGAAGFAVYFVLFNLGSSLLNATTACVIISTSPIITAVLALGFFRERIGAGGGFSIVLAFCGVLVMALPQGDFILTGGLPWMLGAAVCISVYNILQRGLSRRCGSLQIIGLSYFSGAALLLCFLPGAARELALAPWTHTALAVYLGVFPGAVAYGVWTRALALAPKTSGVTNYMLLTPFLALLLEYAVTGALPGVETFAGGGLILCGLLCYAVLGQR